MTECCRQGSITPDNFNPNHAGSMFWKEKLTDFIAFAEYVRDVEWDINQENGNQTLAFD